MPAASEYPQTDEARKVVRELADNELAARSKAHEKHLKYYMGDHKKHLKDDKNNVVINLMRQIIDRTVSFAAPSFPHIVLGDENDTTQADGLWAVWRMNGGDTLLSQLMYIGAMDGHVFVRIDGGKGKRTRIIPYMGNQIVAFWSQDDKDDVLWYEIHWQSGKHQYRQDVVRSGNEWLILDYRKQGSKWMLDGEMRWPSPYGPIQDMAHLPSMTRSYYGQHEFGSIAQQDTVNKVASDYSAILRYHASPRTIGMGFESNQVQATGIDNFWVIPDKDARIQNLEMQSDLQSSMRFLELMINNFLRESRVTMLPLDVGGLRNTTNLGIRAVFMDQIAKTDALHNQYGELIEKINQVILALANQNPEQPQTLKWSYALPEDRTEQTMLVNQQMMMGLLSPQTASAELGLNYNEEQDRIYEADLINSRLTDGLTTNPSNP